MDKYINADKLFTKLDTMKNPDSEFATDNYIDGFSDGVSAAMKELETMSNTDVVEVVRCKDCKHKFTEYDGSFTCNVFSNSYGLPYRIKSDDFCSRGEKKGE